MRLFILKIEGVGMRNVGSNPSARQKTFLKLSIPLARISGTRIIGSMALPFFFYPTPLIFLHSPIFPNNLPSRVIIPGGLQALLLETESGRLLLKQIHAQVSDCRHD